jgi:hypothetical protein
MSELGSVRRYLYWSERRIREVAENNEINLSPRWSWTLRSPSLSVIPQVEAGSVRRNLSRHAIAVKIEDRIGLHAVSDFVTPPKVVFAKGVGDVTFAAYKPVYAKKKGVLLHTQTTSSDGCRVQVILFGSLENCTDYLRSAKTSAPGWSSSSTRDIERFIKSRGTENDTQYDDDESIAVEILRVMNNEGMVAKHVFEHTRSAEWFADVFHDVVLDKRRWNLRPRGDMPEPFDRIVIGAPLWIRTGS